jgi:hypothetical protein
MHDPYSTPAARRWRAVLWTLGVPTLVLVTGFTLSLIYCVGSVWISRLFHH